MKKSFKRILGILLAIALCLSLLPISAFAAPEETDIGVKKQAEEIQEELPKEEILEELLPETTDEVVSEPDEIISEPDEVVPEPCDIAPVEQGDNAPVASPTSPPFDLSPVEPELVKVVSEPLVKVVYHYYDEAQNQNIADIAGYAVASSHTYYAIAMANGENITIAANKYPCLVPVSTDALRFRVLLNGSEDITAVAAYDTSTGLVSLPRSYMGHEITVEWYCPISEIAELPVRVTICIGQSGKFSKTTINLSLASNANSVTVPLGASNGLVVSQNGIDLPESMYALGNGTLTIFAPVLGGELSVSAYAVGIMPMGTNFSQVVHTRSSDQIYYGYYTSYYTANGNTAFCLDPTVSGLNGGTYPISRFLQRGTGNDLLIKCAYYLYGGLGYNSIKYNLFSNPDSLVSYGLCHAAASYAYMGNAEAFKGLDSATISDLIRILNIVNAQPMPPAGFDVFIYNESSYTNQCLMGWDYTPPGHLEITKTSSNIAMSGNNSAYSLAGAIFDVYNASNQKIGSITTDASGKGRLNNIEPGSGYYFVEVKPPQGFAINSTRFNFSITSNQTTTATVSNIPQNDPVSILLRKQDADTSTATPQGDAGIAGAEFTVRYYRGLYGSASQLSGLTPDRMWVFRADANGMVYLNASYLVSGDAFYYATNGAPTIPLGTVSIQETKAPEGYLLNSELFIRQITSQGMAESVYTYSEPIVKDNVIRGGILIEKWDNELDRKANPQGGAALAGSVFEIYNRSAGSVVVGGQIFAPGAVVHTMSTDATGTATTTSNLLPYGRYEIVEKTPPTGYLNTGIIRQSFEIRQNGVIVSLKSSDTVIKNHVIRGGVEVEKWDFDLNRRAVPQGDATLEGAVLEIWNRNANSVLVDGTEYAPNTVVHTLTTNADGWAGTSDDLLPYGQYEIIEKTPPTGYLNTGVIKQTFNIISNGVVVSLKAANSTIKNNVIRGGVSIEKWDIERDERTLKQGDATLAGAVLEIWNRSPNIVVVSGVEYAPDTVVHTLTTNADGWAGTANNLLPYGTYEIVEKTPPVGYLNTGIISQKVEIRENGVIVSMTASEDVIKNNIIRGGIRVEKWDNEIDEHRPQGGATLEGAIFEIINLSEDAVLVLDVLYAPGDVVHMFSTDETGSALTPGDLLPYGTYKVREVTPPTGYLATGVLSTDVFSIREHGKILEFDASDTAIKNNPIRGDLKGVKISDGDAKRLANVPFRITSATTGESHVIVTDRNGEFNTASSWNPHSQNTNRGETDLDGIWFGELRTLNDDLGALLYDTYILDEQRCEANLNYELLSFKISVYRHNTVVDLGTLTDDYIVTPEIFTTARDQDTDAAIAYASATTTIIDTIYYGGLKAGQDYTLKGVLMDKETGAPLLIGDKTVTAEKKFRALAATDSVPMEFTFDATALKGKSVVVFETLEFGGKEIASHTDIDDEGQTIAFIDPKIGTSAAGADGKKELDIGSKVTLIDKVSFENLLIGKTYTVKGVLMEKATGAPLLVDGAKVTAETTFKPDTPSGSVEVVFAYNSSSLADKTVVVFESLEFGGKEIASHADISDKGQTVVFRAPKIGTSAKSADGSKTVPLSQSVTVVDTVAYENLVPREKYMLKGVLMDKETGQPLMKDGKAVTAETAFEPSAASGSVEVRFTFDSRAIGGRTLVVFETLELGGNEIAAHADINDVAQAVSVGVPKDEPKTPAPSPTPATPTTLTPNKPVPQTSDDYSVVLWLALVAIALLGTIISTIFLCKKKRGALIPLVLCIALMAGGVYMTLGELRQYSEGTEAYAELEQFITLPSESVSDMDGEDILPPETAEEQEDSPASSLPSVDFTALRAINPDIVGWLLCEDTPINCPIARGTDNSRYLRYLYDGKKGKAGTPFLDYENSPDFTDGNSVVYGHNRLDGSMFSCLTKYREQAYYDAHPKMLLLTPRAAFHVEVFAAFSASPNEADQDTSPWRQTWNTDAEFAAWLTQIKSRSIIQTGVEPAKNDHILTLSTCISRGRDRFLVMGRLVKAE